MEKESLKLNSKPSFEFVQELLKGCNNHSTTPRLSNHSSVSGYQITHCGSCLINYTKTQNRKGFRLTVSEKVKARVFVITKRSLLSLVSSGI